MRYNAGTMPDTTLQITIRGLDTETKQALVKKARQQGLSLNRYALQSLKQGAGVEPAEERYRAMKQFINERAMTAEDKLAFDEAIAWADQASLAKQKRDEERGIGF